MRYLREDADKGKDHRVVYLANDTYVPLGLGADVLLTREPTQELLGQSVVASDIRLVVRSQHRCESGMLHRQTAELRLDLFVRPLHETWVVLVKALKPDQTVLHAVDPTVQEVLESSCLSSGRAEVGDYLMVDLLHLVQRRILRDDDVGDDEPLLEGGLQQQMCQKGLPGPVLPPHELHLPPTRCDALQLFLHRLHVPFEADSVLVQPALRYGAVAKRVYYVSGGAPGEGHKNPLLRLIVSQSGRVEPVAVFADLFDKVLHAFVREAIEKMLEVVFGAATARQIPYLLGGQLILSGDEPEQLLILLVKRKGSGDYPQLETIRRSSA